MCEWDSPGPAIPEGTARSIEKDVIGYIP